MAFSLLAGALMLPARASLGAVSVVAPPGLARPIDRIELAGTASSQSTVVWCSVHTRRSARFAIVAELTPGASIDTGLDAWLKSLDLVTAPRILPPATLPSSCGQSNDDNAPVLELVQRARGVVAVETLVVEPDGIRDVLLAWNLPEFGASELGVTDPQATLFAALFEVTEGGGVSQPLRIRFDGALSALPFVRTPGWEGVPVSSYLIAPGRVVPRSAAVSAASALAVTYRAVSDTSDYAEVVERFLAPYADVAWLEEASVEAFDQWGFYAEDVAVPPLIDEYFRSARASQDIAADPDICATHARARLAGAVLDDEPGCGAADDLEIALSGVVLPQARVTRYQTLSDPAAPSAVELGLENGEVMPPVIVASSLDQRCGAVSNPPPPTSTPVPSGETDPVYVDPVQDEDYYESSEMYCGAPASSSSSSSSDDCGGDSSSESEDCEGDSSGSDDSYSGDSCSDDSSDDYEGDSCGGDDSPDDSYSGDTCATFARSRPRRPRLSVLTLALCSLLFGARRVLRMRGGSRVL